MIQIKPRLALSYQSAVLVLPAYVEANVTIHACTQLQAFSACSHPIRLHSLLLHSQSYLPLLLFLLIYIQLNYPS